jgi:hypothetical protein
MHFTYEPTNHLPPAPRYVIVSDADFTIAYTDAQTWAEHITRLLNASGIDAEPTPEQLDLELARDQGQRTARDAEIV